MRGALEPLGDMKGMHPDCRKGTSPGAPTIGGTWSTPVVGAERFKRM